MRVGSLFSGIGGFDLALEYVGMEITWQVENDPYCCQVLAKHWPNVPRYGDIKTVRGDELASVDILVGGPPCQPISVAGKRRGKEDDRWLWGEALRLVAELRPRWCLFENPTGIINMGLDDILSALEGQGYTCGTVTIPACAVGAPHQRQRVWIVAHAEGKRCGTRRAEPAGLGGEPCVAGGGALVADPDSKQRNGCGGAGPAGWAELTNRGGESGWAVEPGLGRDFARLSTGMDFAWPSGPGAAQHSWEPPRLARGVPNRTKRLKALGNAVVPQIVEAIGRAILAAEEAS